MSDFAEALVGHVIDRGFRFSWRPAKEIVPGDKITDVHVRWDAGDQSTDSYGHERNTPPSLEVEVTFASGEHRQAEPGWVIEQLMRGALGLELNP